MEGQECNPQQLATAESTHFVELSQTLELITECSTEDQVKQINSIFDRYLEYPSLLDPHLDVLLSQHIMLDSRDIIQEWFESQDEESASMARIRDDSMKRLSSLLCVAQALCKVRGYKTVQRFFPHEAKDVEPVLLALQKLPKENLVSWEGQYVMLLWLGMLLGNVPFDLGSIDSSSVSSESNSIVSIILSEVKERLDDSGPTREAAAVCLASLLARPDMEQGTNRLCFNDFVDWAGGICSIQSDDISKNSHSTFQLIGIIHTIAVLFKKAPRSSLLKCIVKLWEPLIKLHDHGKPTLILRKLLMKLFTRLGCAYLPPRIASWRYQRGQRSLLSESSTNVEKVAQPRPRSKNGLEEPALSHANAETNSCANDGESDPFAVPNEIEDVIEMLLCGLRDDATIVRWSSAKGIGSVTERLPVDCADDVVEAVLELCNDRENDCAWHGACLSLAELARRGLLLPSRLNSVVPIVVKAIQYDVRRGQHSVGSHVRDAACYVCWAFARAYSPSVLTPYVKDLSREMVVTSLFDREVNCRRAASAAFQECVGRQGANNFLYGIDILTRADYFSLGNRCNAYTSVACSVAVFEEYRRPIIERLVTDKLKHWDVEIRNLSARSLHFLTDLDPTYMIQKVLPKLVDICLADDLLIRHGAMIGIAEITNALGKLAADKNGTVSDIGLDEKLATSITEIVPKIEHARLYRGRGGEIMRSAACRLIECIASSHFDVPVKLQVRLLDSIDSSLSHPNEDVQAAASLSLKALLANHFPVSASGPSERLQKRVVDKYTEILDTESNAAATRGSALALGNLPKKLVAPNEVVLDRVLECLFRACHQDARVGGEPDAETRRNAVISLRNVCSTVGISSSNGNISCSPIKGMSKRHIARVFNVFLAALDDYGLDNRGDVGSWSRIAAIEGLEQLTYLATKSSDATPSAFPAPPFYHTKPGDVAVPNLSSRLEYFEVDAQNRVTVALQSDKPLREDKCKNRQCIYFDETICNRIFCALLKQLSEKMDTVRMKAGESIVRLLKSVNPRIPFIPERSTLLAALCLVDQSPSLSCQFFVNNRGCKNEVHTNWANAAKTFPLMMKAVNIDAYFADIISGIVISVGGLSESIVKNSTSALLAWVRTLNEVAAVGRIGRLGGVLLKLFEKHQKEGRVILPLLKTIELLISQRSLDCLLQNENSGFPPSLVDHLKKEARGCKDVKRLLGIADVLVGLVNTRHDDLVKNEIFPTFLSLLSHRYPVIRRHCAEILYVKLQETNHYFVEAECESVSNVLLEVVWDADLEDARLARNQIADLLKITLSDNVRNGMKQYFPIKKNKDEFDCYSSLVKEAGR